jgi:hypothetical protein
METKHMFDDFYNPHYQLKFKVYLNNSNEEEKKIDLRENVPDIYDQEETITCTANAISFVIRYLQKLHHEDDFLPSRLYINYISKNKKDDDEGVFIATAFFALEKYGLCSEKDYPFNKKYISNPKPSFFSKLIPFNYNIYRLKQNKQSLLTCLANKNCFLFLCPVNSNFRFISTDSIKNKRCKTIDKIKMCTLPNKLKSISKLELHIMVCVGFIPKTPGVIYYHETRSKSNRSDDEKRLEKKRTFSEIDEVIEKDLFIVANSYGDKWGDEGYCYMTSETMLNNKICKDFACLELKQ